MTVLVFQVDSLLVGVLTNTHAQDVIYVISFLKKTNTSMFQKTQSHCHYQ